MSRFDVCTAKLAVWPEPRPLPPELAPVPEFDLDLLPKSLQPWIADTVERVQCPADFVAVPAIVAAGSLIGRKVRIRPKAQDNWTVVPNVWGCIIGRPGSMKSPAMSEALLPLRRLEQRALEEHAAELTTYKLDVELAALRKDVTRAKLRESMKKSNGAISREDIILDELQEPPLRRYTVSVSSVQALAEVLRENPNGVLIERDELASLLSTLAQEENAEARGFYLTGADGTSGYTFDTIGRGLNRRVDAVSLSVIGTTQPGKIGRYLRQAQAGGEGDDGMMQRFGLLVWPDGQPDWRNVDRFPDTAARRQAFEVFERLVTLIPDLCDAEDDEGVRYLRFAPDALEAFVEWRVKLELRLRSGELHPALESHYAKHRKTIPALALIIHLVNGLRGPVGLAATLQALAWAEYLTAHAERAYGAATSSDLGAARRILARIRSGDLIDGFRGRDLDRSGWSNLTDREVVRRGLVLLETYGYISGVHHAPSAAGGRPTVTYVIHPSLRS